MTDLSIAKKLFERAFHSEGDRQRLIQQKARKYERDITSALLTNESEAMEIAGDILGFIEPETMVHIMRCALRGDLSGANVARQLIACEIDESVKRVAEHRAVRDVEAMTPEDFS